MSKDPAQSPIKRRAHRFQFRLRTLMIVIALTAAACWIIADRQRLMAERDQARAAEANAKKAEAIDKRTAIIYAEHASEAELRLKDEIDDLKSQLAKKK